MMSTVTPSEIMNEEKLLSDNRPSSNRCRSVETTVDCKQIEHGGVIVVNERHKPLSMVSEGAGYCSSASDTATPHGVVGSSMTGRDLLTSQRVLCPSSDFGGSVTAECIFDNINNESAASLTPNVFLSSIINGQQLHGQQSHIVAGEVYGPPPVEFGVAADGDGRVAGVRLAPTRRHEHFPQLLRTPGWAQWPRLARPSTPLHQLLQQHHLQQVMQYGGSAVDMMMRSPYRYSPYAAMGLRPQFYQSDIDMYRALAEMTLERFENNAISTIREAIREYELQPTQAKRLKHDVGGINLEEIKEFAKAFKTKRLALGITQTQVGEELRQAEGPSYSQSAICRFEKMDITPKSAQRIKPVLEKWIRGIDAKVQIEKDRHRLSDSQQQCVEPSSMMDTSVAGILALPTTRRGNDDAGDQWPIPPSRVDTPAFTNAQQQATPLWSQSAMMVMSSRMATLALPTVLQPSEADHQTPTSVRRSEYAAPPDDIFDEYGLLRGDRNLWLYHSSMLLAL